MNIRIQVLIVAVALLCMFYVIFYQLFHVTFNIPL